MFVTCKSMLNLPGLEEMKIVAGKNGLNRPISWVHVVELTDVAKWVKGGELLFTTGVAIGNNTEILLKFVKDINMRKLSGLVINVGPYIKETPKKVIEFANSVDFPIFELPFQVRLIDVTQNICRNIFTQKLEKQSMNNFMKEIIFEDIKITEEVLNRANLYGYNPNKFYCAMVVDIDGFIDTSKGDIISNIKNNIQEIVDMVMHKNNKKYLYAIQSDTFFFMVPLDDMSDVEDHIKYIAESVKKEIITNIKPITVSIGTGGICNDLRNFNKVILEARKALKTAKIYKKTNCIVNYKEIGIFRLFLDMNNHVEMENIFYENLGKLKSYDEKNSSDLMETLITYLKQNRNLGNTAEKLYIHRNTIKYRIKRIEEILGCDLKDENTVFDIKLSIKIGIFLNSIH
ncbi:PucR family transcriptional regulator ligand-binding domain-containing protein [Clostridium tyrobutyricum]|uniref:PucR family transcriptional regulator n=1 Tax=Clostridium tyrobutyricum TaxID=1519 RepID=UPI0002E5EFB6|nr:PucR family transcriptional regulator ligand-binding domain-containing protein [Clostridium tyrobutyricum]MBR9647618.1 PucR family transcriptional regulator ligand-binding domain-containing protein [Clostridium tyrobutyricum]MBV4424973.1 PucR family transcriptional regulator ligand-binding domain-containing protein [Clostridium tyrobutyricum]MBV4427242.1 PucR family transcriptional regulator ligand-binding domain-containing protein [Clostridium tyrobutyricum]MBV4430065.1 PucR family transcri